jgi:hypothetical protein
MRKFSFLLVLLIIVTSILSSCKDDKDEVGTVISDRATAVIDFYSENKLVNWQDVAAVYLLKKNITDFNYTDALQKIDSYEDKCGVLIAASLLLKQKADVSSYNIDGYVSLIKNYVENNYDSMTTKQLALSVYALVASNTEFDFKAAADYIQSRQNKDGGFPSSKDMAISDTESSAYVLNIITLNRKLFTEQCFDRVVTYLGNVINNDNTLTDLNGKKSAMATALVLNSLISANLPLDGEVSTSLTTAIDTFFKLTDSDKLAGYKKYVDDKSINREANGEVMLCFAATAYGNIWTNIKNDDNSTVSE